MSYISIPVSNTGGYPILPLPTPDVSGFQNRIHSELLHAMNETRWSPYSRPPATPVQASPASKHADIPFIKRAKWMHAQIQDQGSCQVQMNGQSLLLKKIEMIGEGCFSKAYRCEAQAFMGKCVINLFKTDLLARPLRAIRYVGNKLFRYAKIQGSEVLKKHHARHLNFDPLVEEVKKITQESELITFVKKNLQDGFILTEYVSQPLPVDLSTETAQLIHTLRKECSLEDIPEDFRRSNLGLDDEGTLK